MPPEQAAGKAINSSADVYSIGAMLYAMLSGVAPFEGTTQLETILQVLQNEPTALRKLDKSIPKDLEAICAKCMEKDAKDRYSSAQALADDLRRFLAGEPVDAKNDLKRRFRKWTIREPVLAAHVMATIVMLGIVVLNHLLFSDRGQGFEFNLQMMKGNIAILLGWAGIVFVLQKAHNILESKLIIPLIWAAVNPFFLTITICFNEAPRGSLFSLYFLFVISVCFFRQVQLVVITTLVPLVGYLVIVYFFLTPEEKNAPAYLIVFAVNLAICGAMASFLALRMKRLSSRDVD